MGDDLRDQLKKAIAENADAKAEKEATERPATQNIKADYVQLGDGSFIIDRRKTIYVDMHRRKDDTITADQAAVIRQHIEELAKWYALDRKDTHWTGRLRSERRKYWNRLRKIFNVKSYKYITQAQYPGVLEWIDEERWKAAQMADPTIRPPTGDEKAGAKTKLSLILLLILVSFSLIQTPTPHSDPQVSAQHAITKPDMPEIKTADLIETDRSGIGLVSQPGFHIFCGCSLIRGRSPQSIAPPKAERLQSI